MTQTCLPPPWQEDTERQREIKRFALVEMALMTPATRSALLETLTTSNGYWPLIKDNSQPHLIREGPWLLEVKSDQLDIWPTLEGLGCALHAWIESDLNGDRLALQLAPAMVVENPQGARSLLRFYHREAIKQLHADAPAGCYNALFSGIQRWWYRDDSNQWYSLGEMPSDYQSLPNWTLQVDAPLWKVLHGDPEVMKLTAELVEAMPRLFSRLCACDRPSEVAKLLAEASAHGLTNTADRRTYVTLCLEQSEHAWASPAMRTMLQQAANGESSLLDSLAATYGEMH